MDFEIYTNRTKDDIQSVRVPMYIVDMIVKMKYLENEITRQYGQKPSPEEVTRAIKLPLETVEIITRTINVKQAVHPISLEYLMTTKYCEALSTKDQEKEKELQTQINTIVKIFLEAITPREASILKLRFGLHGETERTLHEIGRIFNMSREGIRQIIMNTLKKFKKIIEKKYGGEI